MLRVYTSLICFTLEGKIPTVLTDSTGDPPTWVIDDDSPESLSVVRDGLYLISGISKTFYPNFNQAGTFEFHLIDKEIYIVYTVFFPSIFDLKNKSYKWTKISELDKDDKMYSIIRYLYGSKGTTNV